MMRRREFIAALAAGTAGAVAGCIGTTQRYGIGDEVSVREGDIVLTGVRTTRTLFTQPSDTPPNLRGNEDDNHIVFAFDTTSLDVEESRKHDYLTDFLQYRLSPDTVAQLVTTPPLNEGEAEGTTGVAFVVTTPFDTSGTSLRWGGDNTDARWPATRVFDDQTSAALRNPPSFTVDSVRLPETAAETAAITITVTNNGGTAGPFNAIIRGETTEYVTETVASGETRDITRTIEVDTSDGEDLILVSWGVDQQTRSIQSPA